MGQVPLNNATASFRIGREEEELCFLVVNLACFWDWSRSLYAGGSLVSSREFAVEDEHGELPKFPAVDAHLR